MARSTPTPAAGSIAAQLARLNQFRPGSHRVVTCYLKVEPRDRARGKYLIKVKNRVRALESALPELGLERATVEAIHAAAHPGRDTAETATVSDAEAVAEVPA